MTLLDIESLNDRPSANAILGPTPEKIRTLEVSERKVILERVCAGGRKVC